MADIAAITKIVEPEAQALGFDLVRVAVFGAGGGPDAEQTLQVMAERRDTRQLTVEDCAALSHRISDRLDEAEAEGRDPMEGAYRLEVSSPGIDRPLTRLADFADWAGHEAKVQLSAPVETGAGVRKSFHGNLAGVELNAIAFDDRKSGPVRFTIDQVASAKLLLTDRLIAATRPLDTEGVDEHELDAAAESDLGAIDGDDAELETEFLSSEQDQ